MNQVLRVLLVEDSAGDAAVVARLLERSATHTFVVTAARSVAEAGRRLAASAFDVVLLDLSLPDSSSQGPLEHLERLQRLAPETAFVVLTGMDDDELAVAAMRHGAQDYLRKRELAAPLLERALRYAVERSRSDAALRVSEERYALAARGANDGIWDWDLLGERVYFSPRWKEMLGLAEEELDERPEEWLGRVHPSDRAQLDADLDLHLKGISGHFENEHRMRHRDGTWRWMLARGVAVRDAGGRNRRLAGSTTDVTARRLAEEQLQHDALHDALTGLANRALLRDRLALVLARARRREGSLFALLFLDLDRFKNVNDSLGHAAGDEVLVQVAERLGGCVRPGDTVARLGGDEFAVLADDLGDQRAADRLAERILGELARPVTAAGHEIFVSASVGITVGGSAYERPADVLRDADIAMYRAKLSGPGRAELFDPAMHASAVALLQLENDLKRAVEGEELELHYQPIICLDDGELTGFEALVRWRHPQRGLVLPEEFIPLAEETGLILPLGGWVLEAACRQMAVWRRELPAAARLAVSVNLSGRQLRQGDLVGQVLAALEASGLPAEALRLEVTESVLMTDPQAAIARLVELRALGVQIHIDDFGTGYSSLSWLHSLPTDTLKIDRSFVSGLGRRRESQEIVSTIVALARNLGMRVAAEGLETAEQVAAFRSLAGELGQGYYFSRALPAADTALLLSEPRVWC